MFDGPALENGDCCSVLVCNERFRNKAAVPDAVVIVPDVDEEEVRAYNGMLRDTDLRQLICTIGGISDGDRFHTCFCSYA